MRIWSNTAFIESDLRVFWSNSTNALWKNSGPPIPNATASNTVASCHACPPWANGVMPADFNLFAAALNSSQEVGIEIPFSASTAAFAQIQSIRCTLTGAAHHVPSHFIWPAIEAGRTSDHPWDSATEEISASTPSSYHS